MRLLALDTATEACSAALSLDGAVSERFEVVGRGHADRLLPMVSELLQSAGIRISDLDAIAFGRGPGGFTGLRIAAGIAQGLAAGAGIPVVPVSDLAAVATAGARESGSDRIIAVLDARLGQVYWCAFECQQGSCRAVTAEQLTAPEIVDPPAGAAWFGAGHGFAAYPEISPRLGVRLAGTAPSLLPRARDIAALAACAFAAGQAVPAASARPTYLREDVVHRRGG
jgi:tRNA threonylcarbamoyladenosine biosynthesis protein TsaB